MCCCLWHSYACGLIAKAIVQSKLQMLMDVEYASEFMYSNPVIDEKTLVLAISQSGETIDTLEALKYAAQKRCQECCGY